MINSVEAARIGEQPKSDRAHEVRQNQIDDLPLVPDMIVARDEAFKLLANNGGYSLH
jgi:hypothetical protein